VPSPPPPLYHVWYLGVVCSKLAKLLSKTLASEIQNVAALPFSLLLNSADNMLSRFCSAEMLASITVYICKYGFICVFTCLKWATSASSVFNYMSTGGC